MVQVCAGIPSESERLQEKQHCTVISLQTLYLSFTTIQSFPFFTKHRKFFDQFPSTRCSNTAQLPRRVIESLT